MKILFLSLLALPFLSNNKCNKEKLSNQCFKGRLEIKGICSNYTIKLLEGNLDTAKIQSSWTDEQTHKTYTNVFALGSPCSFPASINEGQEFYFVLSDTPQNCMVCMAYYPKPQKSLRIKVVDNCKQ